jgi:hypothetical protein
MSKAKPQLVLFGTDAALLRKLRPFSADLPYISYETGHGPQLSRKAGGWQTLPRVTGVNPWTIETRGGAESFGV